MKHPVGCPVVTTISRGGWGWFGTIIIVYVLYVLFNEVNIGSGVKAVFPLACHVRER
jgi:hypothetical protein